MQSDKCETDGSAGSSTLLSNGQFVAVKLRRGPRSAGDYAIAGTVRLVDAHGFRLNAFAYFANSGPMESCIDLIVPWNNIDWVVANTDDKDLDLFITEVSSELNDETRRSLTAAGILQPTT